MHIFPKHILSLFYIRFPSNTALSVPFFPPVLYTQDALALWALFCCLNVVQLLPTIKRTFEIDLFSKFPYVVIFAISYVSFTPFSQLASFSY